MQEKFEKLFYEFEPEHTKWGDWILTPQAYFRGDRNMPGAGLNLGYQVILKPHRLETEPHFHREDEYLVFLGAKFPDVFASWDAEVLFYMGPSLDKMEKIVITAPTMIRVPPLFWHGPLEITRLGKPLFFQPVLMNSRYYAIYRRTDAEGHPYKEALVHGVSPCRLDPDKLCSFCGKCRKGED